MSRVLRGNRQPWLFVVLALGFGVIAFFASGESLTRGVVGGLVFGAFVSLWLRVRRSFWRS